MILLALKPAFLAVLPILSISSFYRFYTGFRAKYYAVQKSLFNSTHQQQYCGAIGARIVYCVDPLPDFNLGTNTQ